MADAKDTQTLDTRAILAEKERAKEEISHDELESILTEPEFQATDRTREINVAEIRKKHGKD